jgi:hypothetical protein
LIYGESPAKPGVLIEMPIIGRARVDDSTQLLHNTVQTSNPGVRRSSATRWTGG